MKIFNNKNVLGRDDCPQSSVSLTNSRHNLGGVGTHLPTLNQKNLCSICVSLLFLLCSLRCRVCSVVAKKIISHACFALFAVNILFLPSTLSAQTAGLWIGNAAIGKVSYPADSTASETPVATDTEALLRLIIHVDSTGQARILQRVIQSVEDSTVFLYPDESLVDTALTSDTRRVSSVGFPVMNPVRSSVGTFNDPDNTLVFEIEVGYDDPTNPFKHVYHPDHNNLDSFYDTDNPLDEGGESFTVNRTINLFFNAADDPPADVANDPNWGSTLVGGTYEEKINGLYKQIINNVTIEDIVVEGTFLLRQVSSIDTLTGLVEDDDDGSSSITFFPDGLVTYLTLDEGAGDTTVDLVNEISGTLTNIDTGSSWVSGNTTLNSDFETALTFDGVDDIVNLGNPDELKIGGNQTIEMWVYPASLDDEGSRGRQTILGKAWGGEFNITLDDNLLVSYYYGISGANSSDGQHQRKTTSPTFLTLDTWTHIAVVRNFDRNKLTWYVNGVLANTNTLDFTEAVTGDEDVTLGGSAFGFFKGSIDELRIWNVARTQGEILSTMELRMESGVTYDPTTGFDTDLVAYYPMDDGSGENLSELVFGNDGTLNNMDSSASWVDGNIDLNSNFGTALTFDGVDDFVEIILNPEVLRLTGDMTIEAWIKLGTDSVFNTILSKAYGGEYDLYTRQDSNRIFMLYGTKGDHSGTTGVDKDRFYTASEAITTEIWTHIAVVRDFTNQTVAIYVNGNIVELAATPTLFEAVTGDLNPIIGARSTTSGLTSLFKGEIDELRIWKSARTQEEIQAFKDVILESTNP